MFGRERDVDRRMWVEDDGDMERLRKEENQMCRLWWQVDG